MKSLTLEQPDKLVLKDCPVPQPGSCEVLIRVKSAAICHTDFIVLRGDYPGCKYPTVLGHEFSGIIEKCGTNVAHLKKGDSVVSMNFSFCGICKYCRSGQEIACKDLKAIPFDIDGAFQEFVCMQTSAVFKFERKISFNEAALTEPAANSYSAVERADIKPGDHVVIIGPGPIGLLCVYFAKLKTPSTLTLLGTRKERLETGKKIGAIDTVNIREVDPYKTVMDITSGKGADVVVLCAGTEEAWELSGRILAKYGRIIVEALSDSSDTRWSVPVFDFTSKHISYLGVCGYTAEQFGNTLTLMQEKKVDVSSLITHRFKLEDYKQAFETSDKRIDGAIKVVFEVNV